MTSTDTTGLEIEERGTTLIVRIDGGPHALLTPDLAAQLGELVHRADKDPSIHAVVDRRIASVRRQGYERGDARRAGPANRCRRKR